MRVEAQKFCRPLETLRANRARSTTGATPPDRDGHYPHAFLWDSMFHAIVYSKFGDPEEGAREIEAVLVGQDPVSGFVPNMRFGKGRRLDRERPTFKKPDFSSDYTQPPLYADAVMNVLGAFLASGREGEGADFLKKVYPRLKRAYLYFSETREAADSRIVGVIHPHETGRDSGPEFDSWKWRVPQPPRGTFVVRGLVDEINTVTDYLSVLRQNKKHKKNGWQANLMARKIFWVEDVMFNCIYAQNLGFMQKIARDAGDFQEAMFFGSWYRDVVDGIEKMLWDEESGAYFARDIDGTHIKEVTVSNLSPIILPEIEKNRVETILCLLENPRKFNTPYPVPSVPADSRAFDPTYSERRLWRGPTWINMNWYIVNGLLKQRDRFAEEDLLFARRLNKRAYVIAYKSMEMVDGNGYREFYNPLNGGGMRVEHFGWSTLADTFSLQIPEMIEFESRMQTAS